MKLYNIELPTPNSVNSSRAIRIARKLHQDSIDKCKYNTKMQRWDKYWVEIYDIVLEQLERKSKLASI